MNTVCGWVVANSILKKSFEDKKLITQIKLNCLIYLLYSYYLYKTGDKLFNELFLDTINGPVIPSVEYKFGCFKNEKITNLAEDSLENIYIINGSLFNVCLNIIWNKYKDLSDIDLLNLVNNRMSNIDVLDDIHILDNEICENGNELLKAKIYKKKLLDN